MNSATAIIQKSNSKFTFASTTSKKRRLVAQWLKVDDKLVCQWVFANTNY
jgi:hypothetical protein